MLLSLCIASGKCNDYFKGIWVDIFPLDNVKCQKSFLQDIQARIVYYLKKVITAKLGYERCKNFKQHIVYTMFKLLDTKSLFSMQRKVMNFWNNKDTDYIVSLGSQYGHKKQTFHKSKYYPAKKHLFEGKLYSIPNDWDYILNKIYGDYMKLPPEDKRVAHNPVRIRFEDGEEIRFID